MSTNNPLTKVNNELYIGFFDHLHKGHLTLLSLNPQAAVLTFNSVPRKTSPIYPLSKRLADLKSLGFQQIYVYDIEKENLTAEEFVKQVLLANNVTKILAGDDLKLGCDQKNVKDLKKWIPTQTIPRSWLSSTHIKSLLSQGKVKRANKLTYQPYEITGTVIQGYRRGRELGYPTANLKEDYHCYLKHGSYLTETLIGGKWYPSVTFVGEAKTFQEHQYSIETHILNFQQDLYGEHLSIKFLQYIGRVKKFQNVDDLKKYIAHLIKKSHKLFRYKL